MILRAFDAHPAMESDDTEAASVSDDFAFAVASTAT